MLNLLPSLDLSDRDSLDPYMGLLWHRLHFPLTAFGSLWGEIVVRAGTHTQESKQNLENIEHVPVFLGKSSPRNALSAKLQSITERFVQHAKTRIHSTDSSQHNSYAETESNTIVAQDDANQAATTASTLTEDMSDWQPSMENGPRERSKSEMGPLDVELSSDMQTFPYAGGFNNQTDDLFIPLDNRFFEATFDWFPLE